MSNKEKMKDKYNLNRLKLNNPVFVSGRNFAKRLSQKPPFKGERRSEQPRQEGAGQPSQRNLVCLVNSGSSVGQERFRRKARDAEIVADRRGSGWTDGSGVEAGRIAGSAVRSARISGRSDSVQRRKRISAAV
jgi:hypothetical protein